MTARYTKNDQIFTQLAVVEYLLDEVGFVSTDDLSSLKLLEPASGDGGFAIEVIRRLHLSSKKFNFDFLQALNKNIRFIEIDTKSYKLLEENIKQVIRGLGYDDTLIEGHVFVNDNFLYLHMATKFDCIVGNPPYIRYDVIEKEAKDFYKNRFITFRYRADLYVLFYEHSLGLLSERGKLSFICSNRWLYNQYGQPLREKISKEYHLDKLLNIENSNPFNKSVIAYPSVVTLSNRRSETTLYYETDARNIDISTIVFKSKKTPESSHWENLFLDYDLTDGSLKSIEEQGYTIGIGIATGADKIFIIKKSDDIQIEKSRLLPLLTSKSLQDSKLEWDGSFLVNPFEDEKLCDLDDYPHLKNYLREHKDRLSQRYIAKKSPHQWYKTIDRVKRGLLETPKLLLPDLSSNKFLSIDKGEYYPHHNLYYITHPDINQLKILASILMSDFVKNQLSKIGIKMSGGLPRFQS